MAAKDDLGRRGEALAAAYLEVRGYRIIDRNWRCAQGEIDLVATINERVVFVEVKTRSGLGYGHPLEAITCAETGQVAAVGARVVRRTPRQSPGDPHRCGGRNRAAYRAAHGGAPGAGVLMPIARTRSVSLIGLQGAIVEIEADISGALPKVVIIGLPDSALSEAQHRVRAAAANSGCELTDRRLTVNLSPASLPKHGSGFDLGIALAAFAAAGQVSADSVERVVHLGELGLDGRLRPIDGVLPAVLAAARAGAETVMVPSGNADEAALVPGLRVVGVASLRDAAIWHGAAFDPVVVDPIFRPIPSTPNEESVDLSEVIGNADAVEAIQIAAAGGHHVLMIGPPGAGKTMLAARIPGMLPDLDSEAALEVSSIRSLSGLPVGATLETRPPLEAPHHTATAAALVGGGSGVIRPGAAARASHGVLFLDEAPEFPRVVLDALRQPLESGVITIHRANAVAQFPARFQLVLAANPCPCGQWGAKESQCLCSPSVRRRYLDRLSGPLLDRIDIQLAVTRVTSAQLRLGAMARRTPRRPARGWPRRGRAPRGASRRPHGRSTRRCLDRGSGARPNDCRSPSPPPSTALWNAVVSRCAATTACCAWRGRSPTSKRWTDQRRNISAGHCI